MKRFLNEICPNAYMSLTKVDFKALDKFQVKPIGIYGSKEEIARFLVSIAVIDDTMYVSPPVRDLIHVTDTPTVQPSYSLYRKQKSKSQLSALAYTSAAFRGRKNYM